MEKVMDQDQFELYEKIQSLKEQISQIEMEYWSLYSGFHTFEFWVLLLLWFIAPLVVLYFFIDRRKMFLLGFYGFNIHVWFGYLDSAGDRVGFWGYPYELVPFLSGNISLEATLVPVAFMLVYQWTLNHHKNFYLYSFVLSLVLAFLFKPIIIAHHFFELNKGVTYFHLLLGYCLIFLFSKFITTIFLKMQKK
jgi:hypothetical protein